jgi:hypothetical protein
MRSGRPRLGAMTATRDDGQQPVVPLPERDPAALRAAVAKLDTAALAKFESDWTAATARARDEYSLTPARYFVEHWWTWVAVERWPALAARLRDCERIVAESADRNARRAAAAEISEILRRAESATTLAIGRGSTSLTQLVSSAVSRQSRSPRSRPWPRGLPTLWALAESVPPSMLKRPSPA